MEESQLKRRVAFLCLACLSALLAIFISSGVLSGRQLPPSLADLEPYPMPPELVGVFFLAAGIASGGPDVVGGIVFGALFLLAALAILRRRAREQDSPGEVKESEGPEALE